MTLDSFRELFRHRSRPRKRFGPVWHMWQLFLACLPSMLIAISCTYIEKRRLKELEEIKAEAVRERERERERARERESARESKAHIETVRARELASFRERIATSRPTKRRHCSKQQVASLAACGPQTAPTHRHHHMRGASGAEHMLLISLVSDLTCFSSSCS